MSLNPEVQEDELEEILIYEDLFLEYFNAFLALQAFPVRLFYDRLTGKAQELDGLLQDKSQGYGATDLQREKTLSWLRKERLPLFRRSPLYLEYKLAKLLLRPLEEPRPISRYSIHGYSRQSDRAALSSLPSHPSTADHQHCDSSIQPERVLGPIFRIPSRTRSTPAAPGYLSESYRQSLLEQFGNVTLKLYGLHTQDSPVFSSCVDSEALHENDYDTEESSPLQCQIIPINVPAERAEIGRTEAELSSEDPGIAWHDVNEDYNTTDEEEMFLQEHNLTWTSIQQLKEEALRTREGMGRFTDFLQNTLGFYLLHFWLDCEEFKDCSVDLEASPSSEEARHMSIHLFRSIQNKYQLHLSPECQEQIRTSQQNWGPTFQALRRSQYDALRRLRSYWIPRFLIHQLRPQPVRPRTDTRDKLKVPYLVDSDTEPSINGSTRLSDPSRLCTQTIRKSTDPIKQEHGLVKIQTGPKPLSIIDSNPEARTTGRILQPAREELQQSSLPRMVTALQNDREAGGTFQHFLRRFETSQKSQAFLLWQELSGYSEWGLEDGDCLCPRQVTNHNSEDHLHTVSSHSTDNSSESRVHCQMDRCCEPFGAGGIQLSDLGSAGRLALVALWEPWIRFLQYDIALFLEYCVPATPHETQDLEGPKRNPRKTGKKRTKKDRSHVTFNFKGDKRNLHKRKELSILPGQVSSHGNDQQFNPGSSVEMLQHRVIFKVYRKAIQDTEEPELLKVLEILHALRVSKRDKKILGLMQKVLVFNKIQSPLWKALRKRLSAEILKGRISSSCIEETVDFLGSLLAESFGQFWSEMTGRLKDFGVEQTGNEDWARLEPVLQVVTNKMVLKRLHGRKTNVFHPAQAPPSKEDIAAFHQAMQLAAQGWPTPQVLHFLRYLQTHGPAEGLNCLENNLLCCLEVQKYKNAHHGMPDRGLLRRKVQVIRERFLLPQTNPLLQLSPDLLQNYLHDTEAAATSDLPPLSIFDPLQESLFDSLLPFWAGFQKTWLIRSPSSAQRVPVLRVQQMLRKRLALFELEEAPMKTFHLPPIHHSPERTTPSTVTFSFSMSRGLTVKENNMQEKGSHTPTPSGSQRTSPVCEPPPESRLSPDTIQPLTASG
ncbi:LOW QUALITY PROTEIN: uncharacterized protein WCC33_002572 [Rhinophrynus dorsalis]